MAEPICEDEGLLQEWTPLTQLLQQIPLKTQRGLFFQNLSLTCINVVSEFIALGTNLGFVYWYCRATGDLQKLKFENCHCSVTCIKIVPVVDYMIAAGTDQGTVIVFQIPKIEPGTIPGQMKFKQKQIERFTVNGLHQAAITSIEWDPYEMKVFSGDKTGCVVLTEINLNLHISKSMELLNEQFEIVQLNYSEHILLISTVYRSILCDGSRNWRVCQVGTKERKILGKFGATLCQFQHGLVLFASRPGHRLWLSDKNGVVQQTLIFKSAVQSSCPKIQLINPVNKKEPYDTSFGKVIQFGDNKLITYNSEILYVLHPGAVSVVSVLNSARKILDLAVNENEIFILEGERSLLRISPLPDKYSLDLLYQPVSRRTSFNFDELAAKIKDTAVESLKKIRKDLIPANEKKSPNSPPALADEAVELPPIINLPSGLMPTIFTGENIEIHFSASDDQFTQNVNNFSLNSKKPYQVVGNDLNNSSPFNHDWHEEVITRPLRKRHTKKLKPNLRGSNVVSETESDTTSNISEDRLVCGIAKDLSLSEESAFSQSQASFSVLRDISSLLGRQTGAFKNFDSGNCELMKSSDVKSQTSLDTCESVSERLLLSSEAFRDEQERTFARLANQPLFDSFNSEKTDNMSISLNMTTSSSFSSKASENLPSPSYTSENSGVVSITKSADSQSTDNIENQSQGFSKGCWKWNNTYLEETSSQDENMKDSSDGSITSSTHSQKEQHYPNWTSDGRCLPGDETAKCSTHSSDKESIKFEETSNNVYSESNYYESGFFETGLMNESSAVKNKSLSTTQVFKPDYSKISCQEKLEKANLEIHKEKEKEDKTKKNEFETNSFLVNEALSYGPPSGSSMLGSQLSSDICSIPLTPQISHSLVRDFIDHWAQYKTPEKITSLAVSKNYVFCTDVKERVFYSRLCGLGLSWTLLDYKASMVRVANDESEIWLLNKKSTLVSLSIKSLISDTVAEIAQGIKSFAIDNLSNNGLMVTLNGKIKSYNRISKSVIDKEIACSFFVADIDCYGGVIMALSNDFTVFCKPPEEEQFKVIKTLKPVTSLALGPENLLWMVDEENSIFFSDDFMSDHPHWWQIEISDYIFQNSTGPFQIICNKIKSKKLNPHVANKSNIKNSSVAMNENSVWIFNKFDSSVSVNKTGFTGYMWNTVSYVKLLPSICWKTLCARGVSQDKECIWLLSMDGNIFLISPKDQTFQPIPNPFKEDILCITSSTNMLWILTETGRIHSRIGLCNENLFGCSWEEMRSPDIDNLKFVWVSCGSDVAWACDNHGRTFIAIGSSHQMAQLNPTWVEVEGRPKDVLFQKIFVGSQLYMVWAIDTNGNLYVREGIFPHYQIGTSWVYVCGIEAIHVTISGAYVWALSSNGNIYQRYGVSESNFIGDYWKTIPGNLKIISSSFTEEVWGINYENKIQQLRCYFKLLEEHKNTENTEARSLKEDITWEIVK